MHAYDCIPVVNHSSVFILFSGCADEHIFETKTVNVGETVTLTCTRQRTSQSARLFWIRLVSGTFPESLGGQFTYFTLDENSVKETHHIKAKQELEKYVKRISKAQFSDTAIYYCLQVEKLNITFLKGIFLRVKGKSNFVSDPVRPEDSATLRCSVLSDLERKTCPGDHSVYWFRAGADESHPSLIYAHENTVNQCEKNPEAQSTQKCVYNFSKIVSSSDAGTHYCAVATCGQILFGNGTKVDIKVVDTCDSQKDNTIVLLLFGALAVSLIVIAFLVCAITMKSCGCCNGKKSCSYINLLNCYKLSSFDSHLTCSFLYVHVLKSILSFSIEKLGKQGEGKQQQRKRRSTLMSGLL
uniref:Ig-like domain-containing protein n=1 Tax=Seriola lalandi dorsalis TaxID=1841481 RepID=A0A3B4YU19_SERLL